MTVNVKKTIDGVEQIKTVQTEDLNYYRSEGWVESKDSPKPYTSRKGRKSYFEESKEE